MKKFYNRMEHDVQVSHYHPNQLNHDRQIAYSQRMAKKFWTAVICFIAWVLMFPLLITLHHADVQPEPTDSVYSAGGDGYAQTDSVYVYYRGENGYIRFAKPKGVDYNAFPEHSQIVTPIER